MGRWVDGRTKLIFIKGSGLRAQGAREEKVEKVDEYDFRVKNRTLSPENIYFWDFHS